MTNADRGVRRLLIAVLMAWALTWLTIGLGSAYMQKLYSDGFVEASRAGRTAELAYWNAAGEAYGFWVAHSLFWGLGGLVAGTFLCSLAWWVYRGFRPKQ